MNFPVTNDPFTKGGPGRDEVEIIALELAITDFNYGREVELQMFPCVHRMKASQYGGKEVRVTLHTSQGDFTLRGRPPW